MLLDCPGLDDCVSLCPRELTHQQLHVAPGTHPSCHSPQVGVFRDAGVVAEGRSGEPEGPGSEFFGHAGSRGTGGVSLVGRLACHSTWSMGPWVGAGRKGGSVVEFGGNHPGESGRLSMAPGGELWVGPGAREEKVVPATLLAVHRLVPRPGATLASSSTACPVLFLP